MLRTPLLELLDIEHPIIQAGMGTFGSGAALAAAVSNAGAIGTIGAAKRSPDDLRAELQAVRELTSRPFIVNFTKPWLQLHPECLDCALAAGPRAISVAQGLPGDFVSRIHDSGALVDHAGPDRRAGPPGCRRGRRHHHRPGRGGRGVGGFGGRIGGSVLVPQVADALSPLPVVAAGGITDGRGLAAVLLFGAAGANIGTRFLASVEASLGDDWKQRLVEAPLDGTVHFDASAARRAGRRTWPGSAVRQRHRPPARAWVPSGRSRPPRTSSPASCEARRRRCPGPRRWSPRCPSRRAERLLHGRASAGFAESSPGRAASGRDDGEVRVRRLEHAHEALEDGTVTVERGALQPACQDARKGSAVGADDQVLPRRPARRGAPGGRASAGPAVGTPGHCLCVGAFPGQFRFSGPRSPVFY